MSAQVKPFASIHLLIQVEECTGGGNVIRLGRLLQADPSSARPDTTIGKRSDMRKAKRLSSLL